MVSTAETKGRPMVQSPVQLQTFRHNETGMVMMRAVTLPGFIVFGDSEDELEAKVVPAFESFLEAAQLHDGRHWKLKTETVPGFSPPSYSLLEAA